MTTPTATPPTAEQLTELRREIASLQWLLRDIDEANTSEYKLACTRWIAEAREKADAFYQTVRTMECEATG
jgi:ferric-dicitrate binding protein FerR (iron transport regulator)